MDRRAGVTMELYSWKDVERLCYLKRTNWGNDIGSIEVYPDEVVIYKKSTCERVDSILASLFENKYNKEEGTISLDIGNIKVPVVVEKEEEHSRSSILPLFREVLYHNSAYPNKALPGISSEVIAFHSYKGGVGRTLSLVAFAKAWSEVFKDTEKKSLLIVDADIEAPGLTWLQEQPSEEAFSYLDLLSLIQDSDDVDKIVEMACSKIGMSRLAIETEENVIEHLFIPVYRYKEQLLDLYATPESILNGKNREYILSEVLSKIAEKLSCGAVLVDLRAGISEFSSTLLLDPRVKKYLITSTSTQSVRGTQTILESILKGISMTEKREVPEILLSMVPSTLSDADKSQIISDLLLIYCDHSDDPVYEENLITQLPFASELIHLSSLCQILRDLGGRKMYDEIKKIVLQDYYSDTTSAQRDTWGEEDRKILISKINQLATEQLTAEGNSKFDILMTSPIKHLVRKYTDEMPCTVVMGAKGSGKTFLYRTMSEKLNWETFREQMGQMEVHGSAGHFLPTISTKNCAEITDTLKKCIKDLNDNVSCAESDEFVFLDNQTKLEKAISNTDDWLAFWEKLLVDSINSSLLSLRKLNEELEKEKQKVVFLVDGLEDILKNVTSSESERKAVQILCQDVVAQIRARYSNLGIIIFLRKDMAQASITVNFVQFEQMYKLMELKWSSTEALRLALWLVHQADSSFFESDVKLDSASQEFIEKHLVKLWGLKLGKPSSNEAYSSRWILAALSDFNGQLQARDIIRFLKYASSDYKKSTYPDRILMPTEIRSAVSTCSTEKLAEVKQEYNALRPIFEKLEEIPESERQLPLDPQYANLTADEEKSMIREGYLKRDGDKYYIPEIIRHAMRFKYSRGARPKVLSLTLNR